MQEDSNQPSSSKTLWRYLREGLRRAQANRPVSFYLLLTIPIVLLLGVQIADMRETPRRFVFYLSLIFVFFFVILLRAVVDFFEIWRRHFTENEKVFRTTLGDSEFITQLGERVTERRTE